jgi:MFS family permease
VPSPTPSAYRRVLTTPGAVRFSAAGLVARLPLSMVGLGIVLAVTAATGSYAVAGTVSAAYVGANALCAVFLARFVDRLGQHRVLGAAVTLSATALAGLVVAVELDWPTPVPQAFAALAGATMPNVGAAVRERWSHAVRERALLDTAFAVEAVNDEIVYMVGPVLATALAVTVHPVAGLATAGLAALLGTWALVVQHATEPPRHAAEVRTVAAEPMPWLRLSPLIVGALCLGVLFGGAEVAVVAFAEEAGNKSASGLLLTVWALGSLLSGLVSGAVVFRRSAASRYRIGILVLALLMVPLPFVDSMAVATLVLFLAGFAISPTMIATVSWTQDLVPVSRLNEGMTAVSTGIYAGVAPGAALVGVVVDTAGASPSFWVPAAAGLVGAGSAWVKAG